MRKREVRRRVVPCFCQYLLLSPTTMSYDIPAIQEFLPISWLSLKFALILPDTYFKNVKTSLEFGVIMLSNDL